MNTDHKCPCPGSGCNWPEGNCLEHCTPIRFVEPAPQRAAQEGDLPPLLTDERIGEIAALFYSKWRGNEPFARAIESEVRTAIAAAGGGVPQGWRDAVMKAAEELDMEWQMVEGIFHSLLPSFMADKNEAGFVTIPIDALIESDSYGVHGSDFYRCKVCGAESGAGMLNKGIEHNFNCPLASSPQPEAAPAVAQVPDDDPACRGCGICFGDPERCDIHDCGSAHTDEARAARLAAAPEAPAQAASAEDGKVYKDIADRYFRDTQAAPSAGEVEREGVVISAYRIGNGIDATRVERAQQIEGEDLWAVRLNGFCLSKSGEWSWEPMPSSRTDDWLAEHRFASANEAIDAALSHKEQP